MDTNFNEIKYKIDFDTAPNPKKLIFGIFQQKYTYLQRLMEIKKKALKYTINF